MGLKIEKTKNQINFHIHFFYYLANFGGVYSLFMGVSIVGFLEIPYFITVRLYKNYLIVKTDDKKINVFSKRGKNYSDNILIGGNNLKSKDVIIGHM